MISFLKALRPARRDHVAVFAEFSMRLLGLLLMQRASGTAAPRFRVVR